MLPGEVAEVRVRFIQRSTGAAVDPTAIRLIVLRPQQAIGAGTTYTFGVAVALPVKVFEQESTGNYLAKIVIPRSGANLFGPWSVRFEGDDADTDPLCSGESFFDVTKSRVLAPG